jgi:translation initiation factor 2B subunit (eIF-2B alpha/beta/delta family)
MKKLFGFSAIALIAILLMPLGVYGVEEVIEPVIVAEPTITEMFLEFFSSASFWMISSLGAVSVPGAIYGGVKIINAFKTLKSKVEDETTTVASLIDEIKNLKNEVIHASKNTTDAKTTLVGMITMMNMDGLKKQKLLELLSKEDLTMADVKDHLAEDVNNGSTLLEEKADDLLKQLQARL